MCVCIYICVCFKRQQQMFVYAVSWDAAVLDAGSINRLAGVA